MDKKSEHGKRNVGMGLLNPQANELCKGFNFNEQAPMDSILKVPYLVDKRTGIITINKIAEKGAIKFPKGASHVSFNAGWARIDFINKKSELKCYEVKLLGKNSSENKLVLKPKIAPKIKGKNFFVLKIGFIQVQGGKQYTLGDSKFNAVTIIEVG